MGHASVLFNTCQGSRWLNFIIRGKFRCQDKCLPALLHRYFVSPFSIL